MVTTTVGGGRGRSFGLIGRDVGGGEERARSILVSSRRRECDDDRFVRGGRVGTSGKRAKGSSLPEFSFLRSREDSQVAAYKVLKVLPLGRQEMRRRNNLTVLPHGVAVTRI